MAVSRSKVRRGKKGQNVRKARRTQNTTKFRLYMRVKLVFFCMLAFLIVLFLISRLINITSSSEEKYKKQVLSQQKYDSTTLPYKRGEILDRNGTPLAYSEKVYNVILDVDMMLNDDDNYNPTLNALDLCFEVKMDDIKAYITAKPSSKYYKVAKQVSYEEKAAFEAYVEQQEQAAKEEALAAGVKNSGSHIVGVWFEEEYLRKYPYKTLASDVIGFTGTDNNGQFGLEEYYDDVLNGTTGREYGYLNTDSDLQRTIKPAENGNSIVSTLDMNIQRSVEKVIEAYDEELRDNYVEGAGAENIGVIVMDVNDASILAMATNKGYDLSNPYDLSMYYTAEEISQIKEEEIAVSETQTMSRYTYELNQIWRNFCISDTYEPGSVAKPFTVAMGLEEGTITGNETFECTGSLYRGGQSIACHNTSGHGTVTVSYSIEQSCNVAMMYMAELLGSETFVKYQNLFGFGLKTNIDLAGETRTANLIHTIDTMNVSELATSSFGQGFQVSMIQMAASFASLVNGGYLYQPQMVRQILDENGNVVKNIEPILVKQTISAATSEKIIEYCNATVENGTGQKAKPPGYAIGGKTGTSETLPRGNDEYVLSFLGYAPADDPQVLVYAVVDRPNIENQSAATKYACWIARDVFSEILPYMNIFMTEELTEEEQKALEEKDAAIKQEYQNKRDEEAGVTDSSQDTDNSDEESSDINTSQFQDTSSQTSSEAASG